MSVDGVYAKFMAALKNSVLMDTWNVLNKKQFWPLMLQSYLVTDGFH